MKVQRNKAEKEQIRKLVYENSTFSYVFKRDWTHEVMSDLKYRLYGKIPRNFLLNISGKVGTPTGIFKSTLGLQIAIHLDPMFQINTRVAFSINDLIDLVRNNTEFYMKNNDYINFIKNYKGHYDVYESDKPDFDKLILLRKLIFFLDEQTKTLKIGGITRLQNLVDSCRERQLCFITCGVDSYDLDFSTYDLQRVQESNDDYLPIKKVLYAVYDRKRDIYYGGFRWNVTPLTDQSWKKTWDSYSPIKTQFQRRAMQQQISSMNYEDYAEVIIKSDDFIKCIKYTKKGDKILSGAMVRALIIKKYPDLTNQERDTILQEIRFIFNDTKDNY